LPTFGTSFVGRERELAELGELLEQPSCRLVTILGPGGMGKTRLATEVARQQAERFSRGATFVALDAVTDHAALPLAIAEALRFQPTGAAEPAEQLGAFLREHELLLVLDNFEQLMGAAPLVAELLAAAPGLRCVVTSREVLNLQEEWTFPLEGMGVPPGGVNGELESFAAVRLFAERVRQVRPDLDVGAQAENIVRICRLVEGMPLGLELAASWARYMDCASIADEVERSIDFLATTPRNVPERHRGLHAVFEQSWKLLDDPEQRVLARCAVFRGGFTREAAAEVAGAGMPELAGLVNKSLIRQSADGRYSAHELLRQFAQQRLEQDPGAVEETVRAHSEYFMRFLAERLPALDGARQVEATAEIAAGFANLRLAWMRALEDGRIERVREAAATLHRYFQHRSAYLEAVALYEPSVELLEAAAPSPERAPAMVTVLTALAWFLIRLGRLEEAEHAATRAVELRDADPDAVLPSLGSDPRGALGVLAMTRGDFDEAAAQGALARERAEAVSDPRNLALALYVLVNAASGRGDYGAARVHAERALGLTEQTHDVWFSAYIRNELGAVALAQGDLDAAREHFQASYEARRPFDDAEGMALALGHLGEIALRQGRTEDAESAYRESLTRCRDVGDRGGLAAALCGLGRVAIARGEHAAARERFLQALDIAAEMRFVPLIFEALCDVGELLVASGEPDAAIEVLRFVEAQPQALHSLQSRAVELLEQATEGTSRRRAGRRSGVQDLDAMLVAVRRALVRERSGGDEPWEPAPSPAPEAESLTPREREVLQLMADGRTNPQIAQQLEISVGTAKWYSSQILGKLSVKNRAGAVARARELDILP
jgi:predicted ATPase/DNA-binding CsgD family transcriptional regulator